MELSNNDIFIIDNYNKLKLLNYIFKNLINEKSLLIEEEVLDFYNRMNTNYIIENKIFNNDSNYENSLLFVEKTQFHEFNKINKENINNILSQENVKLLSVFEEEVKTFIKNKNELKTKLKNIKNIKIKDNISNPDLNMTEIYDILNDNFYLLEELFENLKFNQVEKELINIQSYDDKFNQIRHVMDLIISKITYDVTSVESVFVLDNIKKRLNDDNLKLTEEVSEIKKQLNDYANKGEDLSNLVKEYKKINNLIECKKSNFI